MIFRRRSGPRMAALLAVPTLMAAACGGGSSSSSSSSGQSLPGAQSSISSQVPSSVKSSPVQIAIDATYAPNEFVDPSTGAIVGWDVDFAKALCAAMGITCNINNVNFDDIIPQLTGTGKDSQGNAYAVRYQMGVSSFTPTSAREMAGIDFVTYYRAGEQWLVKKGGPSISSAADMCGHSVAVETGTTEESDAWGFMGKKPGGTAISGDTDNCTSAGKQDINVESFTTQTEANSALLSGRAEIGWADSPIAAYQVKLENGQLQLSGQPCSVAPYGVAVAHTSGLDNALLAGVKYLIDNGYYTKILQQWNVTNGAITSANVALNDNNSVGSSCVPSY